MALGFRGRLVTAMATLAALVSLGIGALLMVYLYEDEKARALEQLTLAERVTTEVMERRSSLLLSRLQVVVQDFGFRSAVASRDRATADSALENHSQRAGANFAILVDNSDGLLAATENAPQELAEIRRKLVDEARSSGVNRDLGYFQDQGFELLVTRVEAAGLRAWLIAGFKLNQDITDSIAQLSGTTVALRARGKAADDYRLMIRSDFLGEALETELADARRTTAKESFVQSERYFTRIVDLGSSHEADIDVVLMISRDATLQSYYSRAIEIAILVTAILLLATLGALLIARNMGRPVLQLAHYSSQVGLGHSPPPPQIKTGGELSQLAEAMTSMLKNLRDREAEISYNATHDDITGLNNRPALMAQLQRLLISGKPCCIIGMRLGDLSEINDTLGLEFGDNVLANVSQRLRELLPEGAMLARSGSNEFLLLEPGLPLESLHERAIQIRQCTEQPQQIRGVPFTLRCVVVTLRLPQDASDTNQIRRRLNITFEQAENSQLPVVAYQPGDDESHLRELQLIRDLRTAIDERGLHMNYQPKLCMKTGEMVQVEALVRWVHPQLGFISPEEFIALAERSGLISDLTRHILLRIAEDAKLWLAQGLNIAIAVNLSALDLSRPGLPGEIATIFSGWHGQMQRITLEVTESAVMGEPEVALNTLNELRALGVTLSVDDFGTGYSSLSQLRKMPVQELKIDKSFVMKLASEPQDQLIVRSTLDMAHGLDLKVVAEGVEDLESWRLLRLWGCDLGQGFFMSRPVAADRLLAVYQELEQRKAGLTD